MKKHPAISISALTMAVIIALWLLFAHATLPNENNNGFDRTMLSALKLNSKAKLDPQLDYISGYSDSNIFLTGSNPRAIMVLDSNFKPVDTLALKIAISEEDLVPSKVFINSDNLFIHCYNSKYLVQGNLVKKTLALKKLETEIFAKSIQWSPNFLIIRSFEPDSYKPVIQKIDCNTGKTISEWHSKDAINDFGISDDGFFTFDEQTKTIVYVHYFLNKLIFLDTNLIERKVGHTIDTTYHNSVKIGIKNPQDSTKQVVPVTSRMNVNSNAACYSGKLYVVSELRADNESLSQSRGNATIDIYDIQSGKYHGSFHLPKYKRKPPKDVAIFKNKIFSLYGGEIQCYDLPKF